MYSSSDGWRTQINRAIRDFASSGANRSDALQMFLTTMLREIGEALEIDCCALVETSPGEPPASGCSWSRIAAGGPERPSLSDGLSPIVQRLGLDVDPMVVRAEPEERDDLASAEASAYLRAVGIGVALFVPIASGGRTPAAWVFGTVACDHAWPDAIVEHLQTVGALVWSALPSTHRRERGAVPPSPPIARLPERGRAAPPVRTPSAQTRGFAEIIGESPALQASLAALEAVVETDSSVLLLGETGTGKELYARALHARGPRRAYPLVSVNCAALPPTLIESELFGHQRGAFTGAVALRQGRFELAHRGTLFLDEIGDLPPDLQAKLLRVLQEGCFERVGSSQTQAVDVRIIGATHHDLGRAVAEGRFRADLYYRLNVFPIRLPPLRERRPDIPALVWSIIDKRQTSLRRHITTIPDDVMRRLQQHSWPGNVRELENAIERALIYSTGGTLMLLDDALELLPAEPSPGTLQSVERAHIEGVLRECRWRINGFGNAAERLGLHPNTLRFRMKKLGITRREPAPEARGTGRARAS